jgi:hypothetical protein
MKQPFAPFCFFVSFVVNSFYRKGHKEAQRYRGAAA